MRVYLKLLNLHFCVLVPVLIDYIYPDYGFYFIIIWLVCFFITLFLDLKNG